jgi:Domain of unknown function (DUF4168)
MVAQPKQLLMRTLTAAALASTVPVSAASAQTEPSSPGPTEKAPDISDQKLDAAAAALERMVSLRESYEQRLKAAPASDKERIANEAKDAFVKAISEQGLSVDEYNSILVVAQNDPQIRSKILQRLRPPTR